MLPQHSFFSPLPPAALFYVFELPYQLDSPVMLYLSTGNYIVMLRYGQWLLATPVSRGPMTYSSRSRHCISAPCAGPPWLPPKSSHYWQVLLIQVADMTGRRGSYTPEHLWMVVSDLAAITVFLFGCLSINYGVTVRSEGKQVPAWGSE